MGKVVMWLPVCEQYPSSGKELWVKALETDFAPRADDMVYLSVNEDGEIDAAWYVYRHYWETDGTYSVELSKLVIDPVDERNLASLGHYAAGWHRESKGDPEPMLRRGGWQTYGEWEDARQA